MTGEQRSAALGRSAIVVAAGGGLVALTQRPEVIGSPVGQVLLVLAAAAVLAGLVMAVRALARRGGDRP